MHYVKKFDCITLRFGRLIGYSSALEPSAAATGLPFSVGRQADHRATSSRVRPPPSPSAAGKNGPPTINALDAVILLTNSETGVYNSPEMTSQATRLVRGKETCAEGSWPRARGRHRAFRTTSDAS